MASTCDVYKGNNILGSGSCAAGSATISSFTAVRTVGAMRNITIVITEAGTHTGRSWRSRVQTDGVTSLTLKDVCPFVGA